MLKNNKSSYGWVAILIHWVFALTVFGLFGVGVYMVELTYYDELYRILPDYHRSIGMILFGLLIFRIIWKAMNASPTIEGNKFEKIAASLAHFAMYLLLIVIFVSGYLISTADGRAIEVFGLFSIPSLGEMVENQESVMGAVHKYSTYTLMVFVGVHAIAALKHHFINKDNTLKKMLKPIKNNRGDEK